MKRGVPVINMSLAGPPNEVLKAAIKRALDAGHVIVAAVGNGGPASPPLYPAAYEGVIAVTMEYRSLDPQKAIAVKESLQENALDLGQPGRDEVYGFGLARPRAISTVAR